jgi:hypothetical protein
MPNAFRICPDPHAARSAKYSAELLRILTELRETDPFAYQAPPFPPHFFTAPRLSHESFVSRKFFRRATSPARRRA